MAATQGSFILRGRLRQFTFWCQLLQRKEKKYELWLQHQIIISMYKKDTVNVLWTDHAADTKNLWWPIALFECPWNSFRVAVSSKVLTVCFTSQQICDDIWLTSGLKFKELLLAWSLPSSSCGPLPSLIPFTSRERWTRRQLMTTPQNKKVSGGRSISRMFLLFSFWFCCSLLHVEIAISWGLGTEFQISRFYSLNCLGFQIS